MLRVVAHSQESRLTLLLNVAKTYGAKGLAWIVVKEDGYKTSISKFFNDDQIKEICDQFDAKAGDLILICADRG